MPQNWVESFGYRFGSLHTNFSAHWTSIMVTVTIFRPFFKNALIVERDRVNLRTG